MTILSLVVMENNDRSSIGPDAAFINGLRVAIDGLPALTGSAKQIAWADEIRAERLEALAWFCAQSFGIKTGQFVTASAFDRQLADVNDGLAKLGAAAATRTEAGWWIDRRQAAPLTFLTDLRS